MNIRVVRDDGRPIRLGFAAAREVGLKLIVANLILDRLDHRLGVAAGRAARTARCTT